MASGPMVAVVGGGIIGMSTAWRLAQAGAAVTVFDAGRIGNEASWAAAGMLAPGGEYDAPGVWASMALESLGLYRDFVDELRDASGVAIDYRVCGAFTAAFTEPEALELRSRAARQAQSGVYSEQFPASRVPGLRPGALAAQFYPYDAVVNPRDVLAALRIACVRLGVTLREFEPLAKAPGAPFDCVVIAAGAWSSHIQIAAGASDVPPPRAFPVRGHLIAFEERSGLCDAIVRSGATYLLRRSGHVLIAGASTEHTGFDRALDGGVADRLAHGAGDLIPELRGRRFVAWNGFRPGSETGEPVVGRWRDSAVWLAYGHYRNGILLAPATARLIARQIMEPTFTPASWRTDYSAPAAHPQ